MGQYSGDSKVQAGSLTWLFSLEVVVMVAAIRLVEYFSFKNMPFGVQLAVSTWHFLSTYFTNIQDHPSYSYVSRFYLWHWLL